MSDCCSKDEVVTTEANTGCCNTTVPPINSPASSCCGAACDTDKTTQTFTFDWLLWGSATIVVLGYGLHLTGINSHLPHWAHEMSHGIFELMNTLWWGVVLAAVFVGLLGRIPQAMVTAVLGQGGTFSGVWRATMAGVLMDLCSHGILMVGMQLYRRGASLGQVMAFLIASPWNSFSLTIILVALIGLSWTLAFIALSMAIALFSGWIFDQLERRGVLPANPHSMELPESYRLWPELKLLMKSARWTPENLLSLLKEGLSGSRMVLRWLLFGVVLATAIRSFVDLANFQSWFGPTGLGLAVTLVAATIIEVCSEGSTPIAGDLMNRAGAPGNSFAFMMTGVSTDYTEIMVIKDTMSSWKTALFLPLVTVPQVVVLALLLNTF